MAGTSAGGYTDRLTGGRDGAPAKSLYDVRPGESACPGCFTFPSRSGACLCGS